MAAKKKAVKRAAARRPVAAKKSVRKTTSAIPAGITLPRLGAPMKGQGGNFMGIAPGEKGKPDGIIVMAIVPAGVLKGRYGPAEHVKDAESEHDGMVNTKAMAAAGSEIAKQALSVKIDGHADFYIPARHEARLCDMNGRALCKEVYHWTSTQSRGFSGFAWAQSFGFGTQNTFHKNDEFAVRLVRRVPFTHLTIR